MKRISQSILVSLLSCCVVACAWTPRDDLVILPAPSSSWPVKVGHWENQLELKDASVEVPAPSAEYARNSRLSGFASGSAKQRETLGMEWKDLWLANLRVESPQPLDLRPYLDGTLEFDLKVDQLAQGNVKVKVACGDGCERNVNLLETARAMTGKGWQQVSLAMSCFAREGSDFSKVKLPFALEGNGSGRISVAHVRLTRQGQPNTACPDYRTEATIAAKQNESWAVEWWLPRHQQKLQEARQLLAKGQAPQIVFIGDSITEGWEKSGAEVWASHYAPYHALNLGFGGDRTENVLWRLQNGALDGLAPKVTVLMLGTNNVGHRAEKPEFVAAGMRRVIDEIQQRMPGTKVLLLAIFPRGEKADDYLRGLNNGVNTLLAGMADGRKLFYLDINASLTQPDGTLSKDLMPDFLHPNKVGYEIWQREMAPMLNQLLAQ